MPNNDQNPLASGVIMVKKDHQIAAEAKAMRGPTLSVNQPAASIAPS
jgi:hypothetical protein